MSITFAMEGLIASLLDDSEEEEEELVALFAALASSKPETAVNACVRCELSPNAPLYALASTVLTID